LLMTVRRAIWRAAFLADFVLAMTYCDLEPVLHGVGASWTIGPRLCRWRAYRDAGQNRQC
jgi:hypothetical protein